MRKTLLELLPLGGFFAAYLFKGLDAATLTLMVLTLIALPLVWKLEGKAPIAMLVTASVVGVFGGLSLASHNPLFIKIKPTIVNLLFAAVLLGGALRGKGMLKFLFGSALELDDEGWKGLSVRWGLFFVFLAALNEVIWRHTSTDFWVSFKVFGMLSLTLLFTVAQVPYILKHQEKSAANTAGE